MARPYSERPVRHEYVLTGAGRELADTLAQLSQWGARRRGGPSTRCVPLPVRYVTLELRPWCPTCDRTVEGEEAGEVYEV